LKDDNEHDAKRRIEESQRISLAAEKIAQEKRDLLKEVKEKHDKVAAMQKEMESKSKAE
jgi:hypothetical protein